MTYKIKRPITKYYIPLSDKIERQLDKEYAEHGILYHKVSRFTNNLHGSGINSDWHIQDTKTSVRASNSFHTMNDVGMYDRIVGFTVIFKKGEPMKNFKLQFDDSYGAKKYMLREYLEDEITMILDSLGL